MTIPPGIWFVFWQRLLQALPIMPATFQAPAAGGGQYLVV